MCARSQEVAAGTGARRRAHESRGRGRAPHEWRRRPTGGPTGAGPVTQTSRRRATTIGRARAPLVGGPTCWRPTPIGPPGAHCAHVSARPRPGPQQWPAGPAGRPTSRPPVGRAPDRCRPPAAGRAPAARRPDRCARASVASAPAAEQLTRATTGTKPAASGPRAGASRRAPHVRPRRANPTRQLGAPIQRARLSTNTSHRATARARPASVRQHDRRQQAGCAHAPPHDPAPLRRLGWRQLVGTKRSAAAGPLRPAQMARQALCRITASCASISHN